MDRPYPWKCGTCRERAMNPVVLPVYSTLWFQDGQYLPIELIDLPVLRCDRCNAMMFLDDADERLTAAIVAAAGLLTGAEVRARRDALGITRLELAKRLGISKDKLYHIENGDRIQTRCEDQFLRAFFGLVELRNFDGWELD